MKYETTELIVGADAPFTLLHISDTHLTLADDREPDNGRKIALATARAPYFPEAEAQLLEVSRLSKALGAPILHTGDLNDFVSIQNLERTARFTAENDVFTAAGNHEYSLYVGEAFEDEAYRNQSLDKVQAAFTNPIRFASRVIHGVNLVAIDNSYYQFDPWQLEALQAEVEKGLPILLLMHVPLYNEETFAFSCKAEGGQVAYLMGVPEEKLQTYPPHLHDYHKPNPTTQAAYDYILQCPAIRAVICGHIHHDFDTKLTDSLRQIVTGVGTIRTLRIS